MSAQPVDVAVGDTFAAARRPWDAEPWEVTASDAEGLQGVFMLRRGARWCLAVAADLLDAAQWTRVRAL